VEQKVLKNLFLFKLTKDLPHLFPKSGFLVPLFSKKWI